MPTKAGLMFEGKPLFASLYDCHDQSTLFQLLTDCGAVVAKQAGCQEASKDAQVHI